MHNRKAVTKVLYHVFVILFGFMMVYPVLWMISGSFKGNAEILRGIVYGADKVVCTDEAVIDIITWAVTPYLEGKGTAEDAAREIQSRMSIYLAEQA